MKVTVRIQDVHGSILNETTKELVLVKGLYKKVYIGPLFFEIDPYECLVPNIYEKVELEDASAIDIVLTAYELLKKHGMLKKGTLKTMSHWQHVNGVTDEMLNGYKYETDEEYYKSLKGEN